MSKTNPTNPSPVLSLKQVASLLKDPARWTVLHELCKEPALPVNELARRIGRSPSTTSKQMALMLKLGVVKVGYGRLYSLAPAFRPAPGALEIDLGHCRVCLDRRAS